MIDLPSSKIKDIRGERFGRLLVKSFSHIAEDKGRNAYWVCECDCGRNHSVSSSSLRGGSCVSCGCYKTESSRKVMKALHTKGQHLYFIRSGEFVKIGRTDDVKKRLGQINSMNPHGAELLFWIEDAGDREHEYHELYKESHYSGEWFRLSNTDIGGGIKDD